MNFLDRLICYFKGHKWRIERICTTNLGSEEWHTTMQSVVQCKRCQKVQKGSEKLVAEAKFSEIKFMGEI